MRKWVSLFLGICLLCSLSGCSLLFQDPVRRSLGQADEGHFYTSGGFQDYTDYGIYKYNSITVDDLEKNSFFSVVTESDIDEFLSYIDNFESWISAIRDAEENNEVVVNYDFNRDIVCVGDYFYIKSKEGQPIGNSTYGKFDSYNLYYFDVEAKTLYYFHNNI